MIGEILNSFDVSNAEQLPPVSKRGVLIKTKMVNVSRDSLQQSFLSNITNVVVGADRQPLQEKRTPMRLFADEVAQTSRQSKKS